MKSLTRLAALSLSLCLLWLAVSGGGAPVVAQSGATNNGSWAQVQARRQAAIQGYLASNRDEFLSFKNAPLAIKQSVLNFVGIPMIMFRLFPVIFPDIWGPAADQMAVIGLGPDPFEPQSVMPLGTGYALSKGFTFPGRQAAVQVNYATLTCMGCHTGAVTQQDGTLKRLIGGPNAIGNFFGAVHQTVNDPRYTAANFLTALNAEPVGWVYGNPAMIPQEVLERALFNAPGGAQFFLEEVQFISNQGAERVEETLIPYTYNVPNPPPLTGLNTIPGSLDVFSFAGASEADPSTLTPQQLKADLPPAPAPADIPAAWDETDRPRYQWDDSIANLTYREVAASLTVASGDPASVNQQNVVLASQFVQYLPSPPYPFAVDQAKAARGESIFAMACQGCHDDGNNSTQSPQKTGTDPNRVEALTDFIVTNLGDQMRAACTVPECFGPNGLPVPDRQVLRYSGAYASIPLHGVWATAPYLHNGSVPTLYHLLAGDRPATFYRGNTTYDQSRVGFTWDKATSTRAILYDTSEAGLSNTGHTGPAFNGGIDWKAEPQKLDDLLEYLKTL